MAKSSTARSRGRDIGSRPRVAGAAKASRKTETDSQQSQASRITKELQQKCLNIFADALKPSNDDIPALQEVKSHLYNRDFTAAFGKDEYLRVYASRWSPSRGLAYLQVFKTVAKDLPSFIRPAETQDGDSAVKVVCIGGGAGGELVALAGLLNDTLASDSNSAVKKIHVTLVDIADWSWVVAALHEGVTSPPVLSKYTSQAKKDANSALIDSQHITVDFKRMDVLESNDREFPADIATADLVTIMFTLNELYTTSMSKTQRLLSDTMNAMQVNSHLLVVDSPGSYSTVSINSAEKKYPMQWLLDYTLLGDPRQSEDQMAKWIKVASEDSRWFRLPSGLEYPIDLEDMRYQIHLYRKLADTGE